MKNEFIERINCNNNTDIPEEITCTIIGPAMAGVRGIKTNMQTIPLMVLTTVLIETIIGN